MTVATTLPGHRPIPVNMYETVLTKLGDGADGCVGRTFAGDYPKVSVCNKHRRSMSGSNPVSRIHNGTVVHTVKHASGNLNSTVATGSVIATFTATGSLPVGLSAVWPGKCNVLTVGSASAVAGSSSAPADLSNSRAPPALTTACTAGTTLTNVVSNVTSGDAAEHGERCSGAWLDGTAPSLLSPLTKAVTGALLVVTVRTSGVSGHDGLSVAWLDVIALVTANIPARALAVTAAATVVSSPPHDSDKCADWAGGESVVCCAQCKGYRDPCGAWVRT